MQDKFQYHIKFLTQSHSNGDDNGAIAPYSHFMGVVSYHYQYISD